MQYLATYLRPTASSCRCLHSSNGKRPPPTTSRLTLRWELARLAKLRAAMAWTNRPPARPGQRCRRQSPLIQGAWCALLFIPQSTEPRHILACIGRAHLGVAWKDVPRSLRWSDRRWGVNQPFQKALPLPCLCLASHAMRSTLYYCRQNMAALLVPRRTLHAAGRLGIAAGGRRFSITSRGAAMTRYL